MVTGTVINIRYDKGEYALTQGHKGYAKSGYQHGRYVSQRGYGWASECKPSRITIKVDVEGENFDVWIERYFKDCWGRLSAGRVDAILATVPQGVILEENYSYNGNIYYTVADSCMENWLARAMAVR